MTIKICEYYEKKNSEKNIELLGTKYVESEKSPHPDMPFYSSKTIYGFVSFKTSSYF